MCRHQWWWWWWQWHRKEHYVRAFQRDPSLCILFAHGDYKIMKTFWWFDRAEIVTDINLITIPFNLKSFYWCHCFLNKVLYSHVYGLGYLATFYIGALFFLLQPQALLLIHPSISLLSAPRHSAFTGLCLDVCLTLWTPLLRLLLLISQFFIFLEASVSQGLD